MTIAADGDVVRLVLLLSLVASFALYARFHLVAGGALTGGYLALLILSGQLSQLLGLVVSTLVVVALVFGVVLRYLALPRPWVFYLCVGTSTTVTAIFGWMTSLLPADAPSIALLVLFGSFVIPGLVAYDVAHQGPSKTALAIAGVAAVTLLAIAPILPLLSVLPASDLSQGSEPSRITVDLMSLAAVTVVLVGAVLRLGLGLRSGGFLAPLFIVAFFSWSAFVTVVLAALATHVCMRFLGRRILLTPRQQAMVTLMVGGLVAWAAMYWAATLGWQPATQAYTFAIGPLLATGLTAIDMGRPDSNAVKTIAGVGLGTLALLGVLAVADTWGTWYAVAALSVLALGLIPAALRVKRTCDFAEGVARSHNAAQP